jgi:hypothetical protein
VLWLIKNKEHSHWIKLYADNMSTGEENIIGKLKICSSFFKNKKFSTKDVGSEYNYTPGKIYESERKTS